MQIPIVDDAVRIAQTIANNLEYSPAVEIFISPSINALYSVAQALKHTNLKLAGQNIYFREQGAFTGQTSILSLIDAGCQYCILGHSEPRRIFGEEDKEINLKVHKTLEKGLQPVLCVGETAKERSEGKTEEVIHSQLSGSLRGVEENQIRDIIIAYEPVWAIDNKFLNPNTEIKPATPNQAKEAHKLIRTWLSKNYGTQNANEISIIYGGSLKPSNVVDLFSIEEINGGLIGGASLSIDTFLPIIKAAIQIAKEQNDFKWEQNTLKFSD